MRLQLHRILAIGARYIERNSMHSTKPSAIISTKDDWLQKDATDSRNRTASIRMIHLQAKQVLAFLRLRGHLGYKTRQRLHYHSVIIAILMKDSFIRSFQACQLG